MIEDPCICRFSLSPLFCVATHPFQIPTTAANCVRDSISQIFCAALNDFPMAFIKATHRLDKLMATIFLHPAFAIGFKAFISQGVGWQRGVNGSMQLPNNQEASGYHLTPLIPFKTGAWVLQKLLGSGRLVKAADRSYKIFAGRRFSSFHSFQKRKCRNK
jgi:hypothetical protein